jgi:PAS domain S-box-containing protein
MALADSAGGRAMQYRHRSGRIVPVSVNVRTVRDADGREVHAVATVQDLTETVRLSELASASAPRPPTAPRASSSHA